MASPVSLMEKSQDVPRIVSLLLNYSDVRFIIFLGHMTHASSSNASSITDSSYMEQRVMSFAAFAYINCSNPFLLEIFGI